MKSIEANVRSLGSNTKAFHKNEGFAQHSTSPQHPSRPKTSNYYE
jgi:hypothetical protein